MSNTERTKVLDTARRTIAIEAAAVQGLSDLLDAQFVRALETILAAKGRLVVSGIGKSAIIAQKLVATLNSTGTPAVFLHAADAIHGDIGMVLSNDVVLIISNSGESAEIKLLVPLIRNFGNPLIAITGNMQSFLAHNADILLNTTVQQEACPNNLAPTSSTTAQLVMGDALAIALMEQRGFSDQDFARVHPGGMLGKRLNLRVRDLSVQNEKPAVHVDALLKDVILEISRKRLGSTAVLDDQNKLLGVITDGDLRRMLEKGVSLHEVTAKEIMSPSPKTIAPEALAVEALEQMRRFN
ncbi:MAG: KpsF/GutQ family sugar-phosphate isomerase, partial [Bacteroidetes bacterium]|nr:KpsF/GutQ family sugar-phosphate isomerase [Bacteroidota bacterium]